MEESSIKIGPGPLKTRGPPSLLAFAKAKLKKEVESDDDVDALHAVNGAPSGPVVYNPTEKYDGSFRQTIINTTTHYAEPEATGNIDGPEESDLKRYKFRLLT